MLYRPRVIPDQAFTTMAHLNAVMTERLNNIMRFQIRTKEDALRHEFQAHGWREWIEILEEQQGFGEPLHWLVIRRRPRGLVDWLRHKVWALRVWRACKRAGREA